MNDKYQGPIAFTRGKAPVVMLREWRVTRPDSYSNPNCPGHKDKSARQGYYVDARDADHAREVAREKFADIIKPWETLDVQEWA